MIGNLRYLTADGEVIPASCLMDDFCTYSGELCWSFRSVVDEFRVVVAYEDDPCVWDATCTACVLGVVPSNPSAENDKDRVSDCPTCEGTGVDETIPLHLIGVGSIVTPKPDHWRYGKWSGTLLLVLLSHTSGWWHTGLYRHGGEPAHMETVPTDMNGWTVVRAVPPAHTPND
jgi:hypothetical protein